MKRSRISPWLTSVLILSLVQSYGFTNAAHATAPGSIAFNGNSYISTTVPSGDVPGTGPFTYEFWFYINDSTQPGQGLMNTREGNTKDGFDIQVNGDNRTNGTLDLSYAGQWLNAPVPGTIKSDRWYHIAIVRGSTASLMTLYLDGASLASINLGNENGFFSDWLIIGATGGNNGYFNGNGTQSAVANKMAGKIANFRYVKSEIYSGSFAVPTAPFSTTPTPLILLNTDQADFLRNEGNSVLFSNFNSAAISSSDNPFSPQISTSNDKYVLSFTLGIVGEFVLINNTSHTINVTIPRNTNLASVTPTISYSESATGTLTNSSGQNFSQPVNITITAEDLSTFTYIVTASDLPADFPCGTGTYHVDISGRVTGSTNCAGAVDLNEVVTSLSATAFQYNQDISSITIPNGVTSIPDYAFQGATSLETVTISNSVTSIGEGAFDGTTNLRSITLPSGITTIPAYAFSGATNLVAISIPAGVTSIGDQAFERASSLTSIVIPNSVTSMGWGVFTNATSLENVTLSSALTEIPGNTFYNATQLRSISIPSGVTSIGSAAFRSNTSLASIIIPNGVTSIGSSAFQGASGLTSITIPSSVTSLGARVFMEASGLSSLNIPASVLTIGYEAFPAYPNLIPVTINMNVGSTYSYRFLQCSNYGSCLEDGEQADSFEITAGQLDPGLILNSRSGSITESPTAVGTYTPTFRFRWYDGTTYQTESHYTFITSLYSAPAEDSSDSVSSPLVAVATPLQKSKIGAISTETGTAGTAVPIVITGEFVESVTSIQVGPTVVTFGSWIQLSETLTLTVPALIEGAYKIQIFNGSAPLLNTLNFTALPSIKKTTTPIKKRAKLIIVKCVAGNQVFRKHGASAQCPDGYIKK